MRTLNCNISEVRTILKLPSFHNSTQNQISSDSTLKRAIKPSRKQAASSEGFLRLKVGKNFAISIRIRKQWKKADSTWFVLPESKKE